MSSDTKNCWNCNKSVHVPPDQSPPGTQVPAVICPSTKHYDPFNGVDSMPCTGWVQRSCMHCSWFKNVPELINGRCTCNDNFRRFTHPQGTACLHFIRRADQWPECNKKEKIRIIRFRKEGK